MYYYTIYILYNRLYIVQYIYNYTINTGCSTLIYQFFNLSLLVLSILTRVKHFYFWVWLTVEGICSLYHILSALSSAMTAVRLSTYWIAKTTLLPHLFMKSLIYHLVCWKDKPLGLALKCRAKGGSKMSSTSCKVEFS